MVEEVSQFPEYSAVNQTFGDEEVLGTSPSGILLPTLVHSPVTQTRSFSFLSTTEQRDDLPQISQSLQEQFRRDNSSRMPSFESMPPNMVPIDQPTSNDILFGRGGLTNHHPGMNLLWINSIYQRLLLINSSQTQFFNTYIQFETGNKRFRDIVSLHKDEYAEASKVSKPLVARKIVKAIRNANPPGRFLMRNVYDSKWYDVGDRRAAEKASQALREKSQEEKKSKALDDDSGHGNYMYAPSALPYFTTEGNQGQTFDANIQGGLPSLPEAHTTFTFADTILIAQNQPLYSLSPFEENITATPMLSIQESTEIRTPHPELLVGQQEPLQQQQQYPVRHQLIGPTDENGNIVVTEHDILCGRGGATNHHKVYLVVEFIILLYFAV